MENLRKDIKEKKFHNIYLLYGEEDYLKQQYKRKLKEAVVENDTMNYNYFSDKDIDINAVISICETMPFFEEHRLVVIEDSGFLIDGQEQLAEYLDHIPDTTILVFIEKKIDRRLSIFKKVQAKGYVCEMKTPKGRELKTWAFGFIKREGKNIRESTLDLFLKMTGDDMQLITSEMEKLLCYCMEKDVITDEDVMAVTVQRIEVKIFDLFDAMSAGNQKNTLAIYYELVENKEPLPRILYMLERQFNQILAAKQLDKSGYSAKETAVKIGAKSDWVVRQLLRQAKSFSMKQLMMALRDCADNEERMKSGGLTDKIAVETILIKYSSIAGKRNSAQTQ